MFPASRSLVFALSLLAGGVLPAVPAYAAPDVTHSPQLLEGVESYRLCIAMNLPPDFGRINDPDAAAQVAAQKCADRRLQLAGLFALENPGTRGTRAFIDGVTIRLVSDLGMWLEDVNARRVSPNPAQHRTR